MLDSANPCVHEHDARYFNYLDTLYPEGSSFVHRFECYVCEQIEELVEPVDREGPEAAVDVVRNARAVLTPPGAWITSSYATDASGRDASPNADIACKWCLVGAIRRYTERLNDPRRRPLVEAIVYDALCKTASRLFGLEHDRLRAEHADSPAELFVAFLNDTAGRTHEEILSWCDATISVLVGGNAHA